ncbi:MAG: hypothetical protein ACM3PY_22235, partial [Omnitrophica WOR_2 bacterium]
VVLEALAGLASLQPKRGDMTLALELLLVVLNHPASLQDTRNRANHLRAELEAQLTRQQVEAVRERVRVNTFEAVVEEVLKQG